MLINVCHLNAGAGMQQVNPLTASVATLWSTIRNRNIDKNVSKIQSTQARH